MSNATESLFRSLPRHGAYSTIVADPPWDVGRGPEWGSNGPSRPLAYPTMSVEEIAALPVRALAAKRAHLYIWTINAYVEETYEIARLWGFKPSTLLTWCKRPHGIGLGGTYVLTTEHVLFARRGVLPAAERVETSWWEWSRGPHSAKPEAFLDLVEQVSPEPRVELFSPPRSPRLGHMGQRVAGRWCSCHKRGSGVTAVGHRTTLRGAGRA